MDDVNDRKENGGGMFQSRRWRTASAMNTDSSSIHRKQREGGMCGDGRLWKFSLTAPISSAKLVARWFIG